MTYSILVTNSGIAPVNNIQFSDPIPAGASFVTGSVTVNGVAQPGANPAGGVPLVHWGPERPRRSHSVSVSTRSRQVIS